METTGETIAGVWSRTCWSDWAAQVGSWMSPLPEAARSKADPMAYRLGELSNPHGRKFIERCRRG
jgi:hypothetical protein